MQSPVAAKPAGHKPIDGLSAAVLQIGQPFNPFGIFNGIHIPDALVRSKTISPGAKLVYGRLARYAGQDGKCYPAVETLAEEIGVSARQAQRYLAELERKRLVRRIARHVERAQTSNDFEFLWHEMFEGRELGLGNGGEDNCGAPPVTETSPTSVTEMSPPW